jgi:S-adenosylmethionine hydrolase
VVHAVVARHAPDSRVVDITHQVPAHDVRAGALVLWRAGPWLVPGVILAVVDPGVATARRAVAVAAPGAILVGPDNGLLLPVAHRLGGPSAAVELDPPDERPPGATFAGRDLFAPAAGRAAAGTPLEQLGTPFDPDGLVGQPVPKPVHEPGGSLRAEVLWVDWFGNAQLNAAVVDLPPLLAASLVLEAGPATVAVGVVSSYQAIAPAEVGLVVDSYGLLSVCCDRDSAADRLGLRPGQIVHLRPGHLPPAGGPLRRQ